MVIRALARSLTESMRKAKNTPATLPNSYLIETRIMANIRYFPRSGTTSDVGGMISTTRRKNTYKLVKMEMESVTCKKLDHEKCTHFFY